MRRQTMFMIFAALLTSLVASPHAFAATSCAALVTGENKAVEIPQWRASGTQLNQSGKLSATSDRREALIKNNERWQTSMIDGTMLGKSDTPPFYFVAAEGVRATEVERSYGLNGIITHIQVSGVPDGILRGTLLLPVSGHDGLAKAQQWAKQDQFQVQVQYGEGANGDRFNGYSGSSLVRNGQSLDLVTKQEIEIPLKAGQQTRVIYYRNGSAGVGGYPEGRLMIISWDGQ